MELSIKTTTLLLAILLTGLSAGLFYAWEVSVIPGTKQISDKSYLETMQSINRAILNPGFYLIFFGSMLLLLVSSYTQFREAVSGPFQLVLTATIIYLIGTFGVTVFGNVPMNEALDALDLSDLNITEIRHTRMKYETKWNQWHTIRTICSVLTFVCCLLAAFSEKAIPESVG